MKSGQDIFLTSLDRFIRKGHKNILFMPKRSRLVRKISGPDFKWHLKTGQKKCPKSDHSNTGQSGIRMPTVFDKAGVQSYHCIDRHICVKMTLTYCVFQEKTIYRSTRKKNTFSN